MAITNRIEESKRFQVDLSGETKGLSFYKLVKRHNSEEKVEIEVKFPSTEEAMKAHFGWKRIMIGFVRDYMLQMRNYIAGENKQKLTLKKLMSDALKFKPGYALNPVYWVSVAKKQVPVSPEDQLAYWSEKLDKAKTMEEKMEIMAEMQERAKNQ